MPLRPEFIGPQDGQVKQDCEINAAKRWLGAQAARDATGNDTLLGDDLYADQPFCRQVLLHGVHCLFTCKPASRARLSSWIEGLAAGGHICICHGGLIGYTAAADDGKTNPPSSSRVKLRQL